MDEHDYFNYSGGLDLEAFERDVQDQIALLEAYGKECADDRTQIHYITMYYDPETKRFQDEDGYVIWCPEVLVPRQMIQIFLAQKSYFYATLYGGTTIIELFWLDDEENEGYSIPPWNPD